jgi:hypothetical protein
MKVVSVDLASARYSDLGIVVLERTAAGIVCVPVRLARLGWTGRPVAAQLAHFLADFCESIGAALIVIDGPQAWKAAENGCSYSRVCEHRLSTQGKTGLPGSSKPGTYMGFISFSIKLFDHLQHLGWPRLTARGQRHVAAESFPTSAWRSLGLRALPGKQGATGEAVSEHATLLSKRYGIAYQEAPTHDELQAVVAGLGGLAFAEDGPGFELVGVAPSLESGSWREGFIVNPTPLRHSLC